MAKFEKGDYVRMIDPSQYWLENFSPGPYVVIQYKPQSTEVVEVGPADGSTFKYSKNHPHEALGTYGLAESSIVHDKFMTAVRKACADG